MVLLEFYLSFICLVTDRLGYRHDTPHDEVHPPEFICAFDSPSIKMTLYQVFVVWFWRTKTLKFLRGPI